MIDSLARCIVARQWQNAANILGCSIHQVRSTYDTGYMRVETPELTPEPSPRPRLLTPVQRERERRRSERANRKAAVTESDRQFSAWMVAEMQALGLTNLELASLSRSSNGSISDIRNCAMPVSAMLRDRLTSTLAALRRGSIGEAA